MEREIKFRGLVTDTKEWVFGYYFNHSGVARIFVSDKGSYTITPESVGQFTGLKDKNGVDIYEGDKLKRTIRFCIEYEQIPSVFYDKVIYSGGGFKTLRIDDENRGYSPLENFVGHEIEIIGNIHE